MRCKNCNNQISNNTNYCTVCGAENTNVRQDGNKKTTALIIALVSVAVICLCNTVALFMISKDKNDSEPDQTNSITSIVATQNIPTTKATQESSTVTVSDTTADLTETRVFTTRKTETTVPPTAPQTVPTTKKPAQDPYDIRANGYYAVKNTPNGAGLVRREGSSSTSAHLGIISEGTVLMAVSDYSSLDGGYVYVYDSENNIRCWVLAEFLYPADPYSSYGYTYKNLKGGMLARVSFNTPSDAGLNLRSLPSSTAEDLCLLSEGVVVDVLAEYDSSNGGYIKVGYDHPHAGEYYEGWALAKYLEFYGYQN